jgi:hypothetical protein
MPVMFVLKEEQPRLPIGWVEPSFRVVYVIEVNG